MLWSEFCYNFDISKLFHLVNAENAEVGSVGFFTSNLNSVKEFKHACKIGVLEEVLSDSHSSRFVMKGEYPNSKELYYEICPAKNSSKFEEWFNDEPVFQNGITYTYPELPNWYEEFE